MKTEKLTFEEIQAAELAADNRRQSRASGFAKMHERDQSVQLLSNGATMIWYVDKEANKREGWYTNEKGKEVKVTTYPPQIPEDSFGLKIDGKIYVFNTEEFRKNLRWA